MTIKKQFIDIITYLEENKTKKVSTILDEIKFMASAKNKVSTTYHDEDGNLIAVFCYYHKQWELVAEVEYGAKASSTTGLNNMCKIGCNRWYKQQRVAKQSRDDLLKYATTPEFNQDDLQAKMDDIEADRMSLNMSDAPEGFKDLEHLQIAKGDKDIK